VQRLLTVKEAAELLACSEAAVRKWIYQQRLPKVKVLVSEASGSAESAQESVIV